MKFRVMTCVVAICAVSLMACDGEDPATEDSPAAANDQEVVEETEEAEEAEEGQEENDEEEVSEADVDAWRFETEAHEDEEFLFEAYRNDELVIERTGYLEGGGSAPAVRDELVGTEFCEMPAVVVTLASNVNTGVSTGTLYANVVVDAQDPKVLAVFTAGEVNDKEDGSVISDDQDETVELLREGTSEDEYCGGDYGSSYWSD